MAKQPLGDVVVLLPGILGSVLQRDGKDVWAPTPGAIARGLWTLGRSVRSLELTSDPWEVDDLGDGVTAPRLMSGVHLIPGFWSIDVYAGISAMITSTFDVVPGETYIEFPYDWRRDNRVAARRLQRLTEEKLHAQRQHHPDAKLILIGHSMGGLVARYFLECLGGRADTRMLITFGTPHRGSLNAADFLVNGFVKKLGPLKVADLSRLLRSLTSVYQLLPIYPCVDVGNGHERVAEVDLPHVDRARAAAALHDFHRAIEAGAATHDVGDYAIHSVVGIAQGTKQSAHLDGDRLVMVERFGDDDMGGDGTVPRAAATPIETDGLQPAYQPMYSSEQHGSLQLAEAVQTQLHGILTARPLQAFRGGRAVRVDADDIVATGESVVVRAWPDAAGLTLQATVTDVATSRVVAEPLLRRDADEVHTVEIPPLPAGDYRLRVGGVDTSAPLAEPVHTLLTVVDDAPPDVDPVID
jgi:pimeloyl-ACP methyl ester carboxylesterase